MSRSQCQGFDVTELAVTEFACILGFDVTEFAETDSMSRSLSRSLLSRSLVSRSLLSQGAKQAKQVKQCNGANHANQIRQGDTQETSTLECIFIENLSIGKTQ